MLRYVVRRLVWLPLILFTVTFLTFALGIYGPGDPVTVILGQHGTPEAVERLRSELGLDQPLLIQYGRWVWGVLHGDLGQSLRYRGQSVVALMGPALLVTVQLNAAALILGILIGIPLGLAAAFKRDDWVDRLIVSTLIFGNAVPSFVIAPILLYFLAVTLRILPPGGWNGILSKEAILPVLVLASSPVTILARQTRAAVIDAITADYVRTAHAKGLGSWHWGRQEARDGFWKLLFPFDKTRGIFRGVMVGHVLRNAFISVVTIIGIMVGQLLAGSVLVEAVFGIPGAGRLAVEAMSGYDYAITIAFTALAAIAFVLTNLIVDLLYGVIDPRIRRR